MLRRRIRVWSRFDQYHSGRETSLPRSSVGLVERLGGIPELPSPFIFSFSLFMSFDIFPVRPSFV